MDVVPTAVDELLRLDEEPMVLTIWRFPHFLVAGVDVVGDEVAVGDAGEDAEEGRSVTLESVATISWRICRTSKMNSASIRAVNSSTIQTSQRHVNWAALLDDYLIHKDGISCIVWLILGYRSTVRCSEPPPDQWTSAMLLDSPWCVNKEREKGERERERNVGKRKHILYKLDTTSVKIKIWQWKHKLMCEKLAKFYNDNLVKLHVVQYSHCV